MGPRSGWARGQNWRSSHDFLRIAPMRLRFAEFLFDSRLHRLSRDGQPVELSPKAYALLEILLQARPGAVSKEALYDRLWPKTFVEPGNLHNLVSEIRAARADDARSTTLTAHGFGR